MPRKLSTRTTMLRAAEAAVTGDRNVAYDEPENNFLRIARRWNAHLANIGLPITNSGPHVRPEDVAMMLADVKLGRLAFNPSHQDSWIDVAGYAACGADITAKDAS